MKDSPDADAFDNVLTQLTARAAHRDEGKSGSSDAPHEGQPTGTAGGAADSVTGLPETARGIAKRVRSLGAAAVADSASAAPTPSVNDEQAIANSLSWLLASVAAIPAGSVPPAADAGATVDAAGTPHGPAGGTKIDGDGTRGGAGQLPSPAARIGTMPFGDRQASHADGHTSADAVSEADAVSDTANEPPSIGAPVATPAQMPALARMVAGDPTNTPVATGPAHNAGAAGRAGSSNPTAPAVAGHISTDGDAANPAADVTAVGPSASAAAMLDRVAPGTPASGSRTAPDASSGVRAAAEPPAASKSATPVTTPAAVPIAEPRLGDAHGSTKKDGRGSDEGRADTPLPRTAAAPTGTGLFQLSPEMRAVGGVNTVAGSVDAATAAAATLSSGREADLPNQIVQAIRLQWTQGIGDARITLQPEYLGELSIAIRVEHGAVTAALESSVPAVREWIDSHQPMLRQALAAQGLELARLTTTEPQSAPDQKREGQPDPRRQDEEPRQQQRRRTRSDAPAFELIA